jgi:hypothetical protein
MAKLASPLMGERKLKPGAIEGRVHFPQVAWNLSYLS